MSDASTPPAADEPTPVGFARTLAVPLWVLAGVAMVGFLYAGRPVLLPIVLAVFLFYALDPLVDRLQDWHVPRGIGALTAVALLAATVSAGAFALWPQVQTVVDGIPEATQQLRATLREARTGGASAASAVRKVQEAAAAIDAAAAESSRAGPVPRGTVRVEVTERWRIADALWSGGIGLLGLLGQAVGVLFLTTFLLVEDDAFKRKLIRQFDSMGSKRVTVQILADIALQIERFIWVQAATSALVAVVTGVGLWFLDVDQPAVWGVFAGVMNLVPFFGPLIVTFVVGVVAFLQFGSLGAAGGAALLTIVVTSVEGHFITPQLLSKTAALNLVAIFVSIAFWSWLWGVAGMLLAVPILMAMKVVCDRIEGWRVVGDFLGPA